MMRSTLLMLLFAGPLSACSCLGTASPCTAMGGASVVLVGRVLVDSGEGWGTGTARVAVEEGLLNVTTEMQEVEVNTMAGTSCYRRLQAGERYVIFASKSAAGANKLSSGACSNTFPVRGNEHILEALRNQSRGGAPRLVGTVGRSSGFYSHERGIAGALVAAESGGVRHEAMTDALGHFELPGLIAGLYRIDVWRNGFVPDTEFNRRWSGRWVSNPRTNVFEPDKSNPGMVWIGEKSCEVWDLGMWADSRISGVVRDRAGKPMAGITVQGFGFDNKGMRESRPLRTSETDAEGRYALERLPEGDYVVGVNAELYRDGDAFPPTVYESAGGAAQNTHVSVVEGQETQGINLVLPPKRTAAKLRVQVLGLDSRPLVGETVQLEDLSGVQRWTSGESKTDASGWLELPVYLGESYIVKASHFGDRIPGYDYLQASGTVAVIRSGQVVILFLKGKRYESK